VVLQKARSVSCLSAQEMKSDSDGSDTEVFPRSTAKYKREVLCGRLQHVICSD
jgi:hypothetical protein